MSLEDQVELISSRADLVAFVHALYHDLETEQHSWENNNLLSFLDAIAAWVKDMDGYYRNHKQIVPEQPSWKLLGQILLAAKFYE